MAILDELATRAPQISALSKGPVVNLIGWIAMVTICLAVFTVLASKIIVLRRLIWSDLLIVFAMLFSISFTIATSVQVSNGLGSRLSTLSSASYISFQKAGYAASIMYIFALASAKLSTLLFFAGLLPQYSHQRPIHVVCLIVILWAFSSIFASAFQCSLPKPYLYTTSQCFNQTAFWEGVGIIDIITDVVIMAFPVKVVYNLKISTKKKVAVSFAFSFRFLAIACTTFRITQLPKSFRRGTDITLNSWLTVVATEMDLFFSIFATCVPHLRPFMESIQTGYLSSVISVGDRSAHGSQSQKDVHILGKTVHSDRDNEMGCIDSCLNKSKTCGIERHSQLDVEQVRGYKSIIGQAFTNHDVVTTVRGGGEDERLGYVAGTAPRNRKQEINEKSEVEFREKTMGGNSMIINMTNEWRVSYQD